MFYTPSLFFQKYWLFKFLFPLFNLIIIKYFFSFQKKKMYLFIIINAYEDFYIAYNEFTIK